MFLGDVFCFREVFFEVEEEELIKRLLLRGKDSGRADDQDQSIIENRISVYNAETSPVKDCISAGQCGKGR